MVRVGVLCMYHKKSVLILYNFIFFSRSSFGVSGGHLDICVVHGIHIYVMHNH